MMRTFALLVGTLAFAAIITAVAQAQQNSGNLVTGTVAARLTLINTVVDSDAGSSTNANSNILFGAAAPGDSRLFLVQQGTTTGDPDTLPRLVAINPKVVNSSQSTILNFASALGSGALDTRQFEKGFLGLAFHPNFDKPGMPGYLKFYTYTNELRSFHATPEDLQGDPDFIHPELVADPVARINNLAVLREWTANSTTPTGVTGSSRIILKYADPQDQHNGGTIAFSPVDGYLYWGLGDGGGNSSVNPDSVGGFDNGTDGHTNSNTNGPGSPHGNSQDRNVPFGKMLRINPLRESDFDDPNAAPSENGQYQIPIDNPFTMQSNINPQTSMPYASWEPTWLDEIYAYGLRNPYRFSFDAGASLDDPNRGKLYLNDAGYNDREEVDVIQRGGNYGWVIREGTQAMAGEVINGNTFPTYTAPLNPQTGLPDTLIDPVAEYNDSVGIATIGGFVYRGWKESSLYGKYIFGDNNAVLAGVDAILMYFDPNEVKAPSAPYTIFRLKIDTSGVSFPSGNGGLLGFGQGADGGLYAMLDNGQIYAINPVFTADFNHDGKVDVADLTVWKGALGSTTAGDANGDGVSNGADYLVWQRQFGSGVPALAANAGVPEPAAGLLMLVACCALERRGRGRRSR